MVADGVTESEGELDLTDETTSIVTESAARCAGIRLLALILAPAPAPAPVQSQREACRALPLQFSSITHHRAFLYILTITTHILSAP